MNPIRKRYLVDEHNRRVAVQVDLETFERMEDLLENSGLMQAIEESEGEDTLEIDAARALYASLEKPR
jgi:RelB Antitoxin